MNILVLHNYYRERGGEDAVFEFEVGALRARGHNVVTYVCNNNDTAHISVSRKIRYFLDILHNKKVYREIKQLISQHNIEIAHVHNVFPLLTPKIYHVLKKAGVKVVQTMHNYRFICPNGELFRNGTVCYACQNGAFYHCVQYCCYKNSLVFSLLYAYLINRYQWSFRKEIDRYIALNSFMQQKLVEAGFPSDKIVIKDNAMQDGEVRRSQSGGYFLFLGRCTHEKGVDWLVSSFAARADYKLVVAGTGALLPALQENYKKCGTISFTGFIEGERKNSLLAGAEAVIVPSLWYENYPVVVVEAFRAGIPVIASDRGGLPGIITHGSDGLLFCAGDSDALFSVLNTFTKKNMRNLLGDNARKTYLARMEKESNSKLLEQIYAGAVAVQK